MDFFTADPHFGDDELRERMRPMFSSTDEMDNTIIAFWNEQLKERRGAGESPHHLYILGDFCANRARRAVLASYVNRLAINPENIMLIAGNHDRVKSCQKVFGRVENVFRYRDHSRTRPDGKPQSIVLCHYAMRVWQGSHHGAWHLYGHTHGTLPELSASPSFDCGVDSNDFRLWSLDDVAARISSTRRAESQDQ